MGQPAPHHERFTWVDYCSWPDDERWEVIDGEAYAMAPSPLRRHQTICLNLAAALHEFLEGRDCEAFPAPFDVRLSESDVVQPDFLVVCDPDKIKSTHIDGPPDLAVEVLSPTSLCHDRVRKFQLYQRFGVREYWLVTPHPALIEVFTLEDGHYHLACGFRKEDTLTSPFFPGLSMQLSRIFTFPIRPEDEIREVRESPPPYAARTGDDQL